MKVRHQPDEPPEGAEPRLEPVGAVPLTDAYRIIRRVSPPHAPVAGVLAAVGDRRVLLADADAAVDRVFRAGATAPQHLLAPLDVVRRADGHDLELPWCREPVDRLLDARSVQAAQLGGGELVTLAVSLLRGTREAWSDRPPETPPPDGRWWIDDDGRPVFAPDEDGASIATESRRLLARVTEHTQDRVLVRLMARAQDALDRPRGLHRVVEALEDALFEACAPRPLARATPAALLPGGAREDARAAVAEPPRVAALQGLVERFADTGVAERVGHALDTMRATARRALAANRRLPLAVAGFAAAVVLGAGLLWPSDPPPADARDPARVAPPASPAPADTGVPVGVPSATERPTADPASGRDPAPAPGRSDPPAPSRTEDAPTAAARLADELADCAAHGDPLCAPVRDDAAGPLPVEAMQLAGAGEPVLLDDYGDVAVFRVDDRSGAHAPVLLQIVRLDGRWLVRGAQPLQAPG
jgi:hypothetical protein